MLYVIKESGPESLLIEQGKSFVTYKFNGYDTLTFELSKNSSSYALIQEEVKVTDFKNNYIVKNVDEHSDFVTVSCSLDLDDWKLKVFPEFRTTNKNLAQVLPMVLPADWVSIGEGLFNQHITVELMEGQPLRAVNSLEILNQISSAYGCVFNFDTINKRLSCIDTDSFKVSEEFFTDELNLTDLGFVGNTDNFATRVYAYGKKDEETDKYLTFESINDGKPYVENLSYSNKIVSVGIVDERYTVKQELLKYAQRTLNEVSVPKRSYSCKAINLRNDVWLYKKVTLIDRLRKKHIVHQIVEFVKYDDGVNDTIILSRASPSIANSFNQLQIETQKNLSEGLASIKDFVSTEIKSSTNKITGNKGGKFIWRFDNDGKPIELFNISDTDDLNTAKKVWRWNASGLAHSNNGVNGDYDLALLDDGTINASQILTGILNANIIRAGTITDLTGKNFWNLETGNLNLTSENVTINGKPFKEGIGENIKTGSRNLYVEKTLTKGSINADGSISPEPDSNIVISDFIEVPEVMAIQRWVKKSDGIKYVHWLKIAIYDKNKEFIRFEEIQRGEFVNSFQTMNIFNPQDGDSYIRVYNNYFENEKIKVERGNLFTDWTPAPEDVEGQIVNNYSILTDQINKQILQLQTTAEGLIAEAIKSRVSNTDFGNFKEEVQSKLQIQADNLTLTFNQIQQGLEEIGGYVTNQQLWLRTSIKGLEIGKIDSEVTTLYTNDALKFMYKGKVVAQFTNDFLEVRNVAVSGQMRYGSQWATRLGSEIRNQNKILGNTLNDVWIGG